MNRDKIGTQTCYIHQCTKRYVDVHSMSASQSCLCSFLCNPYITLPIPKFFIYLSEQYSLSHDVILNVFNENGSYRSRSTAKFPHFYSAGLIFEFE